ncbi:DUF3667 domain-containing protein [Marivirga sericea]|uniref:DUF3667 domain-containing protein n=1 Tax=Marivirga sericea TaxID=1028 RepID=UPI001592DE7D|nr:DUF3667 domain-containing protein [Marivirga sericea]
MDTEQNYCPNCGQENSDKKLPLGAFLKDFFSNYLSIDTVIVKTINPFIFRPGKLTKAFNDGKRRRYINPIRLYLVFSLFYFFMISLTVPKDFIDDSIRTIINQKAVLDSVEVGKLDSAGINTIIASAQLPKDSVETNNKEDRWATLKYWANDDNLSDNEFQENLENVGGDLASIIDISIIRGFIKNSSFFTYQAIKNLPLMMFFFLPIFALILKLLFFKKQYYVEHLIHGLHLHSFAYFIYGLVILLVSLFTISEGWVIFLSFLWVSSYTLFSIKRLYGNSWLKSILKFFVLGFVYFSLLLFGTLFELYISLLTL